MGTDEKINICHLASGDLWAGAEVMLAALMAGLLKYDNLRLSAVLYNSGILADKLRMLGLEVHIIEEIENNPFQLYDKTRDFLKRGKFDILHSHRYKENIIGSLAAKNAGIRHRVCTVHGMPEPFQGFRNLKASFYDFLNYRTQRRYLERIITVSEDIRGRLEKKIPAEKIRVVHNGLDLDRLKKIDDRGVMRKSLNLPENCFLIGSVGRMMPVKDYPCLLEAFSIIRRELPETYLALAGDGPDRAMLEGLAVRLGISEYTRFTGFIPETAGLIGSLDIFILSSLHEGISISLLEALALGVPSVVTAVGGNPEVLEDKRQGLHVPPREPKTLASACLKLLRDPDMRGAFGENGRQRIAGHFSKEVMAEKIRDIYTEIARG